ncbi:MAG: serine/threonine-protein kinase [Casimicrobiaceae bacterium]
MIGPGTDQRLGTLDSAQFARLSALLDEALDLEGPQRDAFLHELGARDALLAVHVRDLLASMAAMHDEGLLETRDVLKTRLAAAPDEDATLVGRSFGPYRVLRIIGQGGMGMVWLAERADGLFDRRVALKLVHPGLMGTALTERFARERAILASLEHPNIARLLDAGFTADGQPYLAIEYVDGIPLTRYCDREQLPVRARIGVLLQVLHAVQFAHANLVIHRDLKPSNLLVDGEGQVKLLDFGIAKLLHDGTAHESELTALAGRAFTPDYASPEQITGAPITTASDVYSLGVLLYELLCGQRPYHPKRDSRGALEEAIVTAEAARPSEVALSDSIADARSTSPRQLAQSLRGDLDTIAQKALKKNPADRYATVEALAQDLQRHLAGEVVEARPDSAYYRFSRFVMRHKMVVASAAVVTVALGAGLGVSLWQAGVARTQAAVARNEAAKATAVQDFLLDIFRANSIERPDPVKARETTARELLDLGGKQAEEGLKDSPEARAVVLDTLADMYYQLGLNTEAARQRRRALDVLKQAFGPDDPRIVEALIAYAGDIADLPERDKVLPLLNDARRILDAAHDDASETRGRLWMRLAQANRYTSVAEMRLYADRAVAFFREHYPQSQNVSIALTYAGSARMQQGDVEGAATNYQLALADVATHDAGSAAWAVFPLTALADAQDTLGKLDESEQSYRTALAVAKARFGDFHPETLLTQAKLGAQLHATGRREEGNRLMEAALAGVGKAGYTPSYVIAVLSGIRGRVLLSEGRIEEAAAFIAIDLSDARENFPESTPIVGSLRTQIPIDTARGRYADAAREIDESQRIMGSTGVIASVGARNRLLLDQGRLRIAQGDPRAAIEVLRQVAPHAYADRLPLQIQEVTAKTLLSAAFLQDANATGALTAAQEALDQILSSPLRTYYPVLEADAELRLGDAIRASGEAQTARPHLERALALRTEQDALISPWRGEAEVFLARCMLDLHARSDAKAHAARARVIYAAHPELGRQFTVPLAELLRRLASR